MCNPFKNVSIPERVLEALKLCSVNSFSNSINVSIPERVLEALKQGLIFVHH